MPLYVMLDMTPYIYCPSMPRKIDAAFIEAIVFRAALE